MRYTNKFVNGFHCIFDTVSYENVQVCYLRKDAIELAKKFNNKEIK